MVVGSIHHQRAALNAGLRERLPVPDPELQFEHQSLIAVHALCARLKGTRAMISRKDLTARLLKPFLAHTVILDVVPAPGGARYRHRFIGSAIVALIGEQTGRHLDEVVREERREQWGEAFDAIVAGGVPVRFTVEGTLMGGLLVKAECLAVPLSDDGKAANMVMTVTYVSNADDEVMRPSPVVT